VIREKEIRVKESSRKRPGLIQRTNEKRNKTRRIIKPPSGRDLNPASSISGLHCAICNKGVADKKTEMQVITKENAR